MAVSEDSHGPRSRLASHTIGTTRGARDSSDQTPWLRQAPGGRGAPQDLTVAPRPDVEDICSKVRLRPISEDGMKRIIALALVICAGAMTAQAQSYGLTPANTLDERCRKGADVQPMAWCLGYMEGFRDGVWLGGHSQYDEAAKKICIPSAVTNEQIRDVVLRALGAAPEDSPNQAWELVAIALVKAWRCPLR